MDYKYAFQGFDEQTMARALGRSLPISVKHSVELAKAVRGMMVPKAKIFLENVIAMKQPVKFGRFNRDLAHKKKIGPGRYPVKTAQNFLALIKLAESNAVFKGLAAADLKLIHIAPQQAAARWHYGRQRRRQFKAAHLEIVVQEVKQESKPAEKKAKAPAKATEKKAEVKEKAPKTGAKPVEEKKTEAPAAKPAEKAEEDSQSPKEEPEK